MARKKNTILDAETEIKDAAKTVVETTETTEAIEPSNVSDSVENTNSKRRRRLEARTPTIKSVSGQLEAKTQSKIEKEAWMDVNASVRSRRILSGIVCAVEPYNDKPCAGANLTHQLLTVV